jgi:hypothetical protein
MSSKQQINQRIIFDAYLREKFEKKAFFKYLIGENEMEIREHYVQWATQFPNMLISNKIPLRKFTRDIDICYYFEKEEVMDFSRRGYLTSLGIEKPRDHGKMFFEWAKKKAEEMGMPKNTFKTIKETRDLAYDMIYQWYKQFETTDEMLDWFENDMLK